MAHGNIEPQAVRRGETPSPTGTIEFHGHFIARMSARGAVRLVSSPIDGLRAYVFGKPVEGIRHGLPGAQQHALSVVLAF
jgi:hypothetical protein